MKRVVVAVSACVFAVASIAACAAFDGADEPASDDGGASTPVGEPGEDAAGGAAADAGGSSGEGGDADGGEDPPDPCASATTAAACLAVDDCRACVDGTIADAKFVACVGPNAQPTGPATCRSCVATRAFCGTADLDACKGIHASEVGCEPNLSQTFCSSACPMR